MKQQSFTSQTPLNLKEQNNDNDKRNMDSMGVKEITMTLEQAVKFCEETECEDCPVFINDIEKRHDFGSQLCCENLVDEGKDEQ